MQLESTDGATVVAVAVVVAVIGVVPAVVPVVGVLPAVVPVALAAVVVGVVVVAQGAAGPGGVVTRHVDRRTTRLLTAGRGSGVRVVALAVVTLAVVAQAVVTRVRRRGDVERV